LTHEARKIGLDFLQGLDDYIAANLDNLRWFDIFEIYFDFFGDMKKYKGSSGGFTGLSEYIIFRYIYHLFGGSFENVQISRDLFEFQSNDGVYRLGQNTPIQVESRKYYPDIIIYRHDVPIFVIEIKIYLTNGVQTLMGDIKKLNEIHEAYPTAKCLFINYTTISKNGKIYPKLLEETEFKEWLDFVILDKNEQNIKEHLKKYIL